MGGRLPKGVGQQVNPTIRRITGAAVMVAAAVVLAACTSVSTAPDQTALHYEGGSFSDKKYAKDSGYVPPSTKEWFGPGDTTYLYPTGQRSYDATGGDGSERGPFTSMSKDNVELGTPLSVTFELKTDEQSLKLFHELIGLKYAAYVEDGQTGTSAGWTTMLNFYLGQSLDATVDRILAGYGWQEATKDPTIRKSIEDTIKAELPTLVKSKMGSDFFENWAVQVQRPVPTDPKLRENIAAAQTDVAAAESAKAKADAQAATAKAQVAVAQQEAAKRKAEISAYGSVAEYNRAQAIEKGINPYQPTYIVPGTAPAQAGK